MIKQTSLMLFTTAILAFAGSPVLATMDQSASINLSSAKFKLPVPETVVFWKGTGTDDDTRYTTYKKSSGWNIKYTNKENASVKSKHGWIGWRPKDSNGDEEETNMANKAMEKLWPLQVGKTTSLSYDYSWEGQWWTRKLDVSVERTQRISTPAGEFDTYVLRIEIYVPFASWSADATYWYAPDPGLVVKEKADWGRDGYVRGTRTRVATKIVIP